MQRCFPLPNRFQRFLWHCWLSQMAMRSMRNLPGAEYQPLWDLVLKRYKSVLFFCFGNGMSGVFNTKQRKILVINLMVPDMDGMDVIAVVGTSVFWFGWIMECQNTNWDIWLMISIFQQYRDGEMEQNIPFILCFLFLFTHLKTITIISYQPIRTGWFLLTYIRTKPL